MLRSRLVWPHHYLQHIVQCFKSVKALLVSSRSLYLYSCLCLLLVKCLFWTLILIIEQVNLVLKYILIYWLYLSIYILEQKSLYLFWACFCITRGEWDTELTLQSTFFLTQVSKSRCCLPLKRIPIHELLSENIFQIICSSFILNFTMKYQNKVLLTSVYLQCWCCTITQL